MGKEWVSMKLSLFDFEQGIVGFDVDLVENGITVGTASIVHQVCDTKEVIQRDEATEETPNIKHSNHAMILFAEFDPKVEGAWYPNRVDVALNECSRKTLNIMQKYISNKKLCE